MNKSVKIKVAVNGYGVIGKRVAAAVAIQDDMELVGIVDIQTDWRMRVGLRKGLALYAATDDALAAMREAGLKPSGRLDDLLSNVDLVVDCTPKRIAAKNVQTYHSRGLKFILQGGEKHTVTGHSFVAEANYESSLDLCSTRVVSCNTTSIVRH
jgi:glyceraldehyde-3-phosphate dehydrogenase (NAD(P))